MISQVAYSQLPRGPTNNVDSPTYSSENPSSPIDVSDTTVRPVDETVQPAQSALIGYVLSIRTFSCPLVGTWTWRVEGDFRKGDLAMPWSSVTPRERERDYEGANLTREWSWEGIEVVMVTGGINPVEGGNRSEDRNGQRRHGAIED